MQQNKIEEFAFLYLCGEDDRNLLLGNVSLSFEDFDRLTYLANHFGLQEYGAELWNRYGRAFHQQYELLGALSSGADCDAILRSVMDPEQDKKFLQVLRHMTKMLRCTKSGFQIFVRMRPLPRLGSFCRSWIVISVQ